MAATSGEKKDPTRSFPPTMGRGRGRAINSRGSLACIKGIEMF